MRLLLRRAARPGGAAVKHNGTDDRTTNSDSSSSNSSSQQPAASNQKSNRNERPGGGRAGQVCRVLYSTLSSLETAGQAMWQGQTRTRRHQEPMEAPATGLNCSGGPNLQDTNSAAALPFVSLSLSLYYLAALLYSSDGPRVAAALGLV